MPNEYPWKEVSVTVTMTREQMRELHRVPVREPWLRRVLILLGWKSLQRYREESYGDIFYGDHASEAKVFAGLGAYLQEKGGPS